MSSQNVWWRIKFFNFFCNQGKKPFFSWDTTAAVTRTWTPRLEPTSFPPSQGWIPKLPSHAVNILIEILEIHKAVTPAYSLSGTWKVHTHTHTHAHARTHTHAQTQQQQHLVCESLLHPRRYPTDVSVSSLAWLTLKREASEYQHSSFLLTFHIVCLVEKP